MDRITYNIKGIDDPLRAALPLFVSAGKVLGLEDSVNAVIELVNGTMVVQVLQNTTATGVAQNLQAWRGLYGTDLPISACLEHLGTHIVWMSEGTVAGMLWPRVQLERL